MIPRPSLIQWLKRRLRRVWLCWDRYPQDGTHLNPFCGIVDIRGWAVAIDGIRSVEVFSDEKLLGQAVLGLRRRDLFRLFHHVRASRRGGFQYLLDTTKLSNGYHQLTLVARSIKGHAARTTTPVLVKNLATSYDRYRRQTTANAAALRWMRRNARHLPYRPRVSLGLTCTSTKESGALADTIHALTSQAYDAWELLVAVACGDRDLLGQVQRFATGDDRVTVIELDGSREQPWKEIRRAATGEWVGFLDPGDVLTADALFEMVYHLNRHPESDFAYSDEEARGSFDVPTVPFLKPDWCAEELRQGKPIGRLWLAPVRSLELGNEFDGGPESGEEALITLVAGSVRRVGHVRKVLCSRARPRRLQVPLTGNRFTGDEQPVIVSHAPCPHIDLETIRSILIVKLDHLGDVLLTIPAMRRLREIFPEARITALAGSWARPMLEMEPCLDEVLTYDFFGSSSSQGSRRLDDDEARQVARLFAGRRFDLAIDLRREGDTRHFLRASGATYTVGYANRNVNDWLTLSLPWEDVVPVHPPRRHVALDALRLVEMLALSSRSEVIGDYRLASLDDPAVDRLLADRLPADPGLLVGLHPGAGRAIKSWPADRFACLADRMIEELGATVILFGTTDDAEQVKGLLRCIRRRDRLVSLAYELSLPGFMALLPRLDFFVGNDSGPTHLAGASGIPTLGVYAATIDASQWAPLGPQSAVIQRRMRCSPCYLAKKQDCPYGVACLQEISVDDVWEAALRVLLPKWERIASLRVARPECVRRA
jgi:ADP-heptose:LPS heptosyltransferase